MPSTSKAQISPEYLAGFFDGEGHVTILEANRCAGYASYRIHVGFTNKNLEVLSIIRDSFGGNMIQKKRHSVKHAQAFELRIGNRDSVRKLLTYIQPFVIIKKEQVSLGLRFLDLGRVRMSVIGHRRIHSMKGGTHPIVQALPGEQEKRLAMKSELSKLNARGPLCLQ